MRMKLISAAAATVFWMGAAHAVTVDDYDISYVGAAFIYELNDSARDSDNGYGGEVHLGWPLTEFGYANWAAELTFHALSRDRDTDGRSDYQRGLMLDLVYDFGLFGWGDGAPVAPRFKPFVLGGLGVVQDDVRGSEHEHFGINLGGGALIPLNWHGIAARLEARVLGQDNDKSVADEDILIDYRIGLGLQLPLTPLFALPQHEAPEVAEECELAVVDPITGRSDCGTDSDGDGVLDSLDQCPGTPAGTPVDGRGCTVEPVTTAPQPAPYEAPTEQPLILRGVQFENDTAILTAESKQILDDVAASLKGQPGLRIEIGGHTDSIGNESYNHMLSQQRAEAVRQYLISRGVDGDGLVAMGYGEFKPVASNETPEGRAENRRVELKLIAD
jgi:outer membrane protein OmpA-like peptidoglycan-associated protein